MTASAPKIVGAIDGIKRPGQISGWARNFGGAPQPLRVTARLNSEVVASSRTVLDRPDLGSPCGFALSVPVADVAELLVTNDLEIFAEEHKLEVWKQLLVRLEEERHSREDLSPKLRPGRREYSDLRLPVGLTCPKGLVTVGRNGHLFILGGSNDLLSRYRDPGKPDELDQLAREWVHLLLERSRRLHDKARFLQIFIPEKSTALPDLFPEEISTPLEIYKKIIASQKNEIGIPVLDCYPLLRGNEAYFIRLNSHLSSRGCFRVFEEVLRFFSLPAPGPLKFGAPAYVSSDLLPHLLDQDVIEELLDQLAVEQSGFEGEALIPEAEIRVEGHIGTRVIWKNPKAAIGKKVVAFGNSFFEKGYGPTGLSWWFANWFSEYHFVWSPNVDYEYVDRTQPDIVLAQTIERFLYTLPDA